MTATKTICTLRVTLGQEWLLCQSDEGTHFLVPAHEDDGLAWAFESEADAAAEALSLNWPDGSWRVVELEL